MFTCPGANWRLYKLDSFCNALAQQCRVSHCTMTLSYPAVFPEAVRKVLNSPHATLCNAQEKALLTSAGFSSTGVCLKPCLARAASKLVLACLVDRAPTPDLAILAAACRSSSDFMVSWILPAVIFKTLTPYMAQLQCICTGTSAHTHRHMTYSMQTCVCV